jgi:NADH-quinone oxidoreductase subunit J
MTVSSLIIAALTVAGIVAAMALRNLVHCVLALTVGLSGLAALYLLLGAQFVGFTQVLVYVGAVAILAVFAIMLTQSGGTSQQPVFSSSWVTGCAVASGVFAVLAWAIHASALSSRPLPAQPAAPMLAIGDALMHKYVVPLEIMGLLLTAALIGAVVVAMNAKEATA